MIGTETGPVSNLIPCTSYATHIAPSSGVVIPRYATSMSSHLVERLSIGIASLVLAAVLVGLALKPRRPWSTETAVAARSA